MDNREWFKSTLTEAILTVCREHLKFQSNVAVEGVVGVTLDAAEVFFVHIDNVIPFEQPAISGPLKLTKKVNVVDHDGKKQVSTGNKRPGVTTNEDVQQDGNNELQQQAALAVHVCEKLPILMCSTFQSGIDRHSEQQQDALDDISDEIPKTLSEVDHQHKIKKGKQSKLLGNKVIKNAMVTQYAASF